MMFAMCWFVSDARGDADMADREQDSGSDVGEDESESDEQSDGDGDELLEKRGVGNRQDERERDEERERGQAGERGLL